MTRWFTDKKLRRVAASTLMVAGLGGGMLAGIFASATTSGATGSVLVMESSPESALTANFNPYISSSETQVGATSLIYESVLQFDIAQPTVPPYGFIASTYKWGSGGTSIMFAIRPGIKYSDGSTLTAADVAKCYSEVGANAAINGGGVAITSATSAGNVVTVNFSSAQYTNLQNIGTVPIVGPAFWTAAGSSPATYADAGAIAGTGPYKLQAGYSSGTITLVQNPNYWGGPQWTTKAPWVTPATAAAPDPVGTFTSGPTEVQFPQIGSNTSVLSLLDNNTLDWAGNFITGLSSTFLKGTGHAVWFAPVNTVTMWPNLTVFPTNMLAVREAISLAVNRNTLSFVGESGFEPPATSMSGLTEPGFSSLVSSKIGNFNDNASIKAAKAVLVKAGWKMGQNGYFNLKGKELSLNLGDPSAYTDYASDCALAADELRAAGFNATFIGQTPQAWGQAMQVGHFQLDIHWGASSISAYQVYNNWLNSKLIGTGGGDFERSRNAAMQTDLTTLAGATTVKAQKADLLPIEQYVAANLPVIPILYGASFDEYNTGAFSGWPTSTNAYESGSPNTPTNEVIVLHLTAAS